MIWKDRYVKGSLFVERKVNKVFKAIDRLEGKEVAYNEVPLKDLKDLETKREIERIKHQINILKASQSSHVLSFYGDWEEDGKFVFVTELVTCTLRSFVQRTKGVGIAVVRDWSLQILEGLHYLHSQKAYHLEIHMDNLFFIHNAEKGTIKFGLGLDSPVTLRSHEFTPMQLNGMEGDVWSFGMCMIEISTLDSPFDEFKSDLQQIQNAVSSGIKPLSLMRIEEPTLLHFIWCCLMISPKKYTASELLKHVWIRNSAPETSGEFVKLREKEEYEELTSKYGATQQGWLDYFTLITGQMNAFETGDYESDSEDVIIDIPIPSNKEEVNKEEVNKEEGNKNEVNVDKSSPQKAKLDNLSDFYLKEFIKSSVSPPGSARGLSPVGSRNQN